MKIKPIPPQVLEIAATAAPLLARYAPGEIIGPGVMLVRRRARQKGRFPKLCPCGCGDVIVTTYR